MLVDRDRSTGGRVRVWGLIAEGLDIAVTM